MSQLVTTSPEFFQLLKDAKAQKQWVIFKLGAAWCPTCADIQPRFERYAQETSNSQVKFYHGDVDILTEVESKWPTDAMPTFMVFYNEERLQDKGLTVRGGDAVKLRKLVRKVEAISDKMS